MFMADYKTVNGKPICEFEILDVMVQIPCTLYEGFWLHPAVTAKGEASTYRWTVGIQSGVGITTTISGKRNAKKAALLIKPYIKSHEGTTVEDIFGSVELAREVYGKVKELMV